VEGRTSRHGLERVMHRVMAVSRIYQFATREADSDLRIGVD